MTIIIIKIIIIIIIIKMMIIIIILLTLFRLGFLLASLDWGGGGQTPHPPPFLKNYRRYRHETYTTN